MTSGLLPHLIWRGGWLFNTLFSVNNPDGLEARLEAGYGPAPSAGRRQAPQRLTRAVAAVLDLLSGQPGPVTAADLAVIAGHHPNTMREHLDALVDAGLATRARAEVGGRGRPAWLYRGDARAGEATTASEYAGLATALAMQLARTSPSPRQDAVQAGEAWGTQLARSSPAPAPSATTARRQVVQLLDGLGFDPSADRRASVVRLRHCPLLEAAREQPEVVCAVHLGIVRGAMSAWGTDGQGASLVPFAEPGACRLHLLPPAEQGAT